MRSLRAHRTQQTDVSGRPVTRRNSFMSFSAFEPRRNGWGGPDWYYIGVQEAIDELKSTEPDATYVKTIDVSDDAHVIDGRRVRWHLDSNYVVWINADKIEFTPGNSWNRAHARALFDLIEAGDRPVFSIPAARVYRIDENDVAATVKEDAEDELDAQRGMAKPWKPADVGQLHAFLLDGNHRALAAIAAGEESIPVIVGDNYREDVLTDEWVEAPKPKKPRRRKRAKENPPFGAHGTRRVQVKLSNPPISEAQADFAKNSAIYRDQAQRELDEALPGVKVVKVTLIGSYAAGTATDDSDVDMLVVYEGDAESDAVAAVVRGKIVNRAGLGVFDVWAERNE